MNARHQFSTFVLSVILLGIQSGVMVSQASEDFSNAYISGDGTLNAEAATISRLIGQKPKAASRLGEKASLEWNDARLEGGGGSLNVRIAMDLTIGQSIIIGQNTEFPGLVTLLDDAIGQVVDLETGHIFDLRLAQRGSWIARFIHSDSRGEGHLALELPFSLFNKATGVLIAQNNLMIGFDLANKVNPAVVAATFSPTPYPDLRLRTTDVAEAMRSDSASILQKSNEVSPDFYQARVTTSQLNAIVNRDHSLNPSDLKSTSFDGCDSADFMELEIGSSGFSRSGRITTPEFTLRLRYAPVMVTADNIYYLEPLMGELTIHYQKLKRVITVGPGNHGHFASRFSSNGNDLNFQLGLSLREGSTAPVIARLEFVCTQLHHGEGLRCGDLHMTTATDIDGRVVSPAPLSGLLEKPYSFEDYEFALAVSGPDSERGRVACPTFCQVCDQEGCLPGEICELGVDHHPWGRRPQGMVGDTGLEPRAATGAESKRWFVSASMCVAEIVATGWNSLSARYGPSIFGAGSPGNWWAILGLNQ